MGKRDGGGITCNNLIWFGDLWREKEDKEITFLVFYYFKKLTNIIIIKLQ